MNAEVCGCSPAQLAFQNYPRRGARKLGAEDERAAILETGQALPAMRQNLFLIETGPGLQHQVGTSYLTPPHIGNSDHRRLAEAFQLTQDRFNLGGIHVLATRDVHILAPIHNVVTAIGVPGGRIARLEPTVTESLAGPQWLVF